MLERFRQAGIPCYLETSAVGDVDLYAHLGFRLLEEYGPPGTGLTYYAMLSE